MISTFAWNGVTNMAANAAATNIITADDTITAIFITFINVAASDITTEYCIADVTCYIRTAISSCNTSAFLLQQLLVLLLLT